MSHSVPPDQLDESLRGILSHINTSPFLWNLAVVVRAEALAEHREDKKLGRSLLPDSGLSNFNFLKDDLNLGMGKMFTFVQAELGDAEFGGCAESHVGLFTCQRA